MEQNESPLDILRAGHPEWSEEQIREAVEALDEYIMQTMLQYERIRSDEIEYGLLQIWLDDERKRRKSEMNGDSNTEISPHEERE